MFEQHVYPFRKREYMQGRRPDVECILCAIGEHDRAVTSLEIFRTGLVAACVNLYPYNSGHLMVFPLRHLTDIRELTREEECGIASAVRFLLDALDECYRPSGYNMGWNMGSHAGASIPHLHQHIIPRYDNELGVIDLIGGAKVLIEDPNDTRAKLAAWADKHAAEFPERLQVSARKTEDGLGA